MLSALIFDVDGTLADTESMHRDAFNMAFAEAGLDWYWDTARYGELLDVAGGKERIRFYWERFHPESFDDLDWVNQQVAHLHTLKTTAYTQIAHRGGIPLRPGVAALIDEAKSAGLHLAIATTTTPDNIDALLGHAFGAAWRRLFDVVGDALSAPKKKPHPQVYQQVLAALELPATACIAIEDSANGLAAATAASIPTLITTTTYTAGQDFSSALRVLSDLSATTLAQLRQWHAAFPIRLP